MPASTAARKRRKKVTVPKIGRPKRDPYQTISVNLSNSLLATLTKRRGKREDRSKQIERLIRAGLAAGDHKNGEP